MDSRYREGIQERTRVQLDVKGTVQGVGFRPFVYRLAERLGVSGFVRNIMGEVIVEAEGTNDQIKAFVYQLRHDPTPPIRVNHIRVTRLPISHDAYFTIEASKEDGAGEGGFPTDLATCMECMQDIHNPHSKYYRYPFTSCTSCGPRYSVLRKIPYDREHTTFKSFPLCESCRSEYIDPFDRRFHAQTLTCPHCGPAIEYRSSVRSFVSSEALLASSEALREGRILAVKGIGGFHFICDATQEQAIHNLRIRKRRPRKPFALMARDLNDVENLFVVTAAERQALTGPEAPIVLLKPKEHAKQLLPLLAIAPGLIRIGVFLPYTPLHHILISEGSGWFVATSGNASGHPMTYRNDDALSGLRGIADGLLLHSRDIAVPIDDSVGHVVDQEFRLIRSARGYVPVPLRIPLPPALYAHGHPDVIGIGAEMKNTCCLIKNGVAYVSQHLGDMDTNEDLVFHRQVRDHMMQLFDISPEIIAYDPHPNYAISQEGLTGKPIDQYPVLHHHAHMAACMVENELDNPVIGCILDGSGYGADGSVWGFEVLTGDFNNFRRIRSLHPLLLPGGEAAIRNPWMIGISLIDAATHDRHTTLRYITKRFPQYSKHFPILFAQLTGKLPSPRVSSAGRLFDGVSAILGICMESTYEGEAALQLSELADPFAEQPGDDEDRGDVYPFEIVEERWDVTPTIRSLLIDLDNRLPTSLIVLKFHRTVAAMVTEGVRAASNETGIRQVVLSGGVWNNRYLLSDAKRRLLREGFTVYTHRTMPSGDGGISLGQAVCGLWRWAKEHVLIGTCDSDRSR
ncbi:carbamoyltransferase HypF [Paenibacillus chungangensis]|uniref:Carbamoyltransferase n=1 Tax=Paenibacillus chungangensis TaxID=696535 RepID=A0ABW3HNF6_9BACL